MKSILCAIVAFIAPISSFAQWRLDAGVRLGRSNVDHYIPSSSHGTRFRYTSSFSLGADVNIGRELNRGWGLYSGLMYDLMRFEGIDMINGGLYETFKNIAPGMHVFSFVTVPVKIEYRCAKDIIRPYAGFGAGFQIAEHENRTEEYHGKYYYFKHDFFVPTALFGLNLEYKRFIVGFAQKIDLKDFWRYESIQNTWRLSQTTAKIGFRIF